MDEGMSVNSIQKMEENTSPSPVVKAFDELRNEILEMEQRVDDLFTQFGCVLGPSFPVDPGEGDKETDEMSDITRATRSLEHRARGINNRLSELKLRCEL